MALGDVYRCDLSGTGGFPDQEQPSFWEWVLTMHWLIVGGDGDDASVANHLGVEFVNRVLRFADEGLFGRTLQTTHIRCVNQRTGVKFEQEFVFSLAPFGEDPLPPQVCVIVTGRADALGRRTLMYWPGISTQFLRVDGTVEQVPPVTQLGEVYWPELWIDETTFEIMIAVGCIFDRSGANPTVPVTRTAVGGVWRSQRRRALSHSNPDPPPFIPVPEV